MTTKRRRYEDVTPVLTGGITWTCDDKLPAKFHGRTLTGGRPCLGPKGEAVKFLPFPGNRDYVVVHVEGHPSLAEAVAVHDAAIEEDERRNRESMQAWLKQREAAPAESDEAAILRSGEFLSLPTGLTPAETARLAREARRGYPTDNDIRGLEGNEDL